MIPYNILNANHNLLGSGKGHNKVSVLKKCDVKYDTVHLYLGNV